MVVESKEWALEKNEESSCTLRAHWVIERLLAPMMVHDWENPGLSNTLNFRWTRLVFWYVCFSDVEGEFKIFFKLKLHFYCIVVHFCEISWRSLLQ